MTDLYKEMKELEQKQIALLAMIRLAIDIHSIEILTSKQIVELYPIGATALKEMVQKHLIPCYRMDSPRMIYFKKSEVNDFFFNSKTKQILNT